MNLVTLTAVMGVLATIIGAVTVPVLMSRKADKEKAEATENVTFEKLNRALDRQNERLEERLQLNEEQHAKEIADLQAKYEKVIADQQEKYAADQRRSNQRIKQLEDEQTTLLRRLARLDGDG